MAKFTFDEIRICLNFADRVGELARQSPQPIIKRELYQVAASIRIRFGLTDEQKKAVIKNRVLNGAGTVGDLIGETSFNRSVVRSCVKALEDEGVIVSQPLGLAPAGCSQTLLMPVKKNGHEGDHVSSNGAKLS